MEQPPTRLCEPLEVAEDQRGKHLRLRSVVVHQRQKIRHYVHHRREEVAVWTLVANTLRLMVSGLGRRKMTEGNLGTVGESGDISQCESRGNKSSRRWNRLGSSQNRPVMAQCGFDKAFFQGKTLVMQLGKPNGIFKLSWFVDEHDSFKIRSKPRNKTMHQK
ncbi:hypothetical protein GOBAR_DD36443 [Gossypium barbadense]|nr:hypothetical protein GOBAR_DD36443 [Gossypium barbadense]